jgi:hypothetical protein
MAGTNNAAVPSAQAALRVRGVIDAVLAAEQW